MGPQGKVTNIFIDFGGQAKVLHTNRSIAGRFMYEEHRRLAFVPKV
jgi:hypothetical protein